MAYCIHTLNDQVWNGCVCHGKIEISRKLECNHLIMYNTSTLEGHSLCITLVCGTSQLNMQLKHLQLFLVSPQRKPPTGSGCRPGPEQTSPYTSLNQHRAQTWSLMLFTCGMDTLQINTMHTQSITLHSAYPIDIRKPSAIICDKKHL